MIAAHDAAVQDKKRADFVCNAANDQDVINAAVARLPATGGQITLTPGSYVIRKTSLVHKGKPVGGGILINKSNVVLRGSGPSTRLLLADAQDCNVIRITGVSNILVEGLSIDANYEKQTRLDRAFESCGIRASWIHEADGEKSDNIVVRDCIVRNAAGLGIMLWGTNVKALNNVLSDNQADDIELLGGPGEIRGNTVTRSKGSVDSMVGSDAGDCIRIADNTLIIKSGGNAGIAIRSWEGFSNHIISGNIIRVEQGGDLHAAIDSRTSATLVTGNLLECQTAETPCIVSLTGGNVVTGNIFRNTTVGLASSKNWKTSLRMVQLTDDQKRPVVFAGNQMIDSSLDAASFQAHSVALTAY